MWPPSRAAPGKGRDTPHPNLSLLDFLSLLESGTLGYNVTLEPSGAFENKEAAVGVRTGQTSTHDPGFGKAEKQRRSSHGRPGHHQAQKWLATPLSANTRTLSPDPPQEETWASRSVLRLIA